MSRLAEKFPDSRLLLLLDEIENITFDISPSPHWSEDFLPFWQTVRSVHQDMHGRLSFVSVGVNPHMVEADRVGNFDNPIFSTTKPFYLGPFDYPTLRAMVRRIGKFMGLQVEESLYQMLFEEYGGHPFLVRQACSHLARSINSRPAEITTALYERNRDKIAVQLEKNIKQILNVLAIWYPQEYELLMLLAQGDRSTFTDFARDSAAFTEHVEGYGLVADARSDPKIRIGLVQRYLSKVAKQSVAVEATTKNQEEVLAEISRRRNKVEIGLRRVLKDGLRFSRGTKAAEAAVGAIKEERRGALLQHSYEDMWQEMYFTDLMAILDAHWEDFARFFGVKKPELMSWLGHINRCRADAHAKELNADDLAFLRVCFRRLEETVG